MPNKDDLLLSHLLRSGARETDHWICMEKYGMIRGWKS
jgi:hypothetical protein